MKIEKVSLGSAAPNTNPSENISSQDYQKDSENNGANSESLFRENKDEFSEEKKKTPESGGKLSRYGIASVILGVIITVFLLGNEFELFQLDHEGSTTFYGYLLYALVFPFYSIQTILYVFVDTNSASGIFPDGGAVISILLGSLFGLTLNILYFYAIGILFEKIKKSLIG